MIEIDGKKLYTEIEWERRHRHVLKSQRDKGVVRTWRATPGNVTSAWYGEGQTRPWNKRELRAAARDRAEKRTRKHDEEVAAKARMEAEVELLRRICGAPVDTRARTADQWLRDGFVPIDEARWRRGDPSKDQSDGYFFCEAFDVRYNPPRAAELLEAAPWEHEGDPRAYEGLPWW